MKKIFKFVVVFFALLQITACSGKTLDIEGREPIVVPPLEYLRFVSWNRPFNTPIPNVEGEIVLAFDDFGNSQLFYSCSQEKIERNLDLEKVEGIYFSIYWGYEREPEEVVEDVEQRIDTESMARFQGQIDWGIKMPETVTCSRKVVNSSP